MGFAHLPFWMVLVLHLFIPDDDLAMKGLGDSFGKGKITIEAGSRSRTLSRLYHWAQFTLAPRPKAVKCAWRRSLRKHRRCQLPVGFRNHIDTCSIGYQLSQTRRVKRQRMQCSRVQ